MPPLRIERRGYPDLPQVRRARARVRRDLPVMLATSEGYPPLGNITGSSFQEIWEGPAYAKLRTELREIAIFGGRFDASREHCYARKACSMHHACPIVAGLADPEFYDEAFSEIQKLRRGPGVTARRWSEAIMTHRPFIGASKP